MDSNDIGEILLLVLNDDLFWIEKEQETKDVETV